MQQSCTIKNRKDFNLLTISLKEFLVVQCFYVFLFHSSPIQLCLVDFSYRTKQQQQQWWWWWEQQHQQLDIYFNEFFMNYHRIVVLTCFQHTAATTSGMWFSDHVDIPHSPTRAFPLQDIPTDVIRRLTVSPRM